MNPCDTVKMAETNDGLTEDQGLREDQRLTENQGLTKDQGLGSKGLINESQSEINTEQSVNNNRTQNPDSTSQIHVSKSGQMLLVVPESTTQESSSSSSSSHHAGDITVSVEHCSQTKVVDSAPKIFNLDMDNLPHVYVSSHENSNRCDTCKRVIKTDVAQKPGSCSQQQQCDCKTKEGQGRRDRRCSESLVLPGKSRVETLSAEDAMKARPRAYSAPTIVEHVVALELRSISDSFNSLFEGSDIDHEPSQLVRDYRRASLPLMGKMKKSNSLLDILFRYLPGRRCRSSSAETPPPSPISPESLSQEDLSPDASGKLPDARERARRAAQARRQANQEQHHSFCSVPEDNETSDDDV